MGICCGFIGLGLIGGSVAKALRESQGNVRIIAYDTDPGTLSVAVADGTVDVATDRIDETYRSCDFLFLCAPVQKNDANLQAVQAVISPDCILTDVGSVKSGIHEHVHALGLDGQFIGGHPMAGNERSGYLHSRALLLQNAYYILTPTARVQEAFPEKTERYRNLVQGMGAIPLVLNSAQHDYATAAISHLPHVISAALVNLVKTSDSPDGLMKMIAAGGFKDITRISSSSATMWQQICLTNTDNILSLLDDYINSLMRIREQLSERDGEKLWNFFEEARVYRDSFISASSGPIKISYSFRVDIADKPGALAAIVSTLAGEEISIKNIGITHNREAEGGVLSVEFYDETSAEEARRILSEEGYNIYVKNL